MVKEVLISSSLIFSKFVVSPKESASKSVIYNSINVVRYVK